MCRLIIPLFFILWSSSASAANYYVDFASGLDTYSGTADISPFKHCPGDANATDTALAVSLAPGDTVFFKGGVSYTGSIDLNWSGSVGSPITYDGNSGGTWGAGKAIIDNENSTALTYGFNDSTQLTYIDIKNFMFTNIGGYTDAELSTITESLCPTGATSKPGTGISFGDGSAYINITDCDFYEIGEFHNLAGFVFGTISGTGVSLQNNDHIIVDGCDFRRVATGVSIKATAGNAISNIDVRNSTGGDFVVWWTDVAPRSSGATISGISIHNNTITDQNDWTNANWLGCGDNPHLDGIFLRNAIYYATWNDINIYNNRFADSGTGTAAIYSSQGPSVNVYNNEFIGISHGEGSVYVDHPVNSGTSPEPQIIRIYNNSFISSSVQLNVKGEYAAKRKVYVANNIFLDIRTGMLSPANVRVDFLDAGESPVDQLENNLYWSTDPMAVNNAYINGSYRSFSGLQALGYESNGVHANPLFVNYSNLALQSESLAIDKGTNLSPYFATDIDSIIRPQGTTWDIGAYEFVSEDTTPPSAPIGLNAL